MAEISYLKSLPDFLTTDFKIQKKFQNLVYYYPGYLEIVDYEFDPIPSSRKHVNPFLFLAKRFFRNFVLQFDTTKLI